MAAATTFQASSVIDQIGEAAGAVWHHLDQHGAVSLTKLVKELDLPRDLVMQSIGWLGREDKVWIEDEGRTRVVRLRD
ncbi:MAG: winged helix-turn-helix domain-containing protein [Planctomycetaceae bacterium]|nr:winged helix-turn-helix domain-containing protein [Planctomycetaceae bacterium]